MALGTITLAQGNEILGDERVTVNTIVGDSSYPTGGTSLPAASLGLSVVKYAVSTVRTGGANGPVNVHYIVSSNKLQCFSATGEVSNATDLSGATIQIIAFGY